MCFECDVLNGNAIKYKIFVCVSNIKTRRNVTQNGRDVNVIRRMKEMSRGGSTPMRE